MQAWPSAAPPRPPRRPPSHLPRPPAALCRRCSRWRCSHASRRLVHVPASTPVLGMGGHVSDVWRLPCGDPERKFKANRPYAFGPAGAEHRPFGPRQRRPRQWRRPRWRQRARALLQRRCQLRLWPRRHGRAGAAPRPSCGRLLRGQPPRGLRPASYGCAAHVWAAASWRSRRPRRAIRRALNGWLFCRYLLPPGVADKLGGRLPRVEAGAEAGRATAGSGAAPGPLCRWRRPAGTLP